MTFDGRVLGAREVEVRLWPNTSSPLWRGPVSALTRRASPREVCIVAELLEGGAPLARNIHHLAAPKDQALPPPGLRVATRVEGETAILGVTSAPLARAVCLTSAVAGDFRDNYFDLLPGESIEVRFWPRGVLDLEALRASLRVRTLADPGSGPASLAK